MTGAVTVYDPAAGSYVPVRGAVVSIPELARSVTTNDLGKFTMGGLPFGEFEVRVVAGQSSFTHTINIPVQPVTLKDNFRISARNGEIAFTLAAAF